MIENVRLLIIYKIELEKLVRLSDGGYILWGTSRLCYYTDDTDNSQFTLNNLDTMRPICSGIAPPRLRDRDGGTKS